MGALSLHWSQRRERARAWPGARRSWPCRTLPRLHPPALLPPRQVCAEAGDLRNALHTADMLRAAGLRMDAILYTTLISGACLLMGLLALGGCSWVALRCALAVLCGAAWAGGGPCLPLRLRCWARARAPVPTECPIPPLPPRPLPSRAACAAAGDAEQAFAQYAAMKADGVNPDRMVYSSVIKACAETINRLPPSERCAAPAGRCLRLPAAAATPCRRRPRRWPAAHLAAVGPGRPKQPRLTTRRPPVALAARPRPLMRRRQQLVLLERAFALVEDAKAARAPTDAAVWNALVTAAGRAGQLQRAFNVRRRWGAAGAPGKGAAVLRCRRREAAR